MTSLTLDLDALAVDSFVPADDGGPDGCICDMPPCICSAGPDCVRNA